MTPFERLLSDVEGGLGILADIDMTIHDLSRGKPVNFGSIQHLLERCKNAILALGMDQEPPPTWTFLDKGTAS
jgi:hypothetical protein